MSEFEQNISKNEPDRKERKIMFWVRIVYLGMTIIASWLWGWKGFVGALIVAGAIILNGFLAEWEDNQPGGFNNPFGKGNNDESMKLRWFHYLLLILAFVPILGVFAGIALIYIGRNKLQQGRWALITIGLLGILLCVVIYPGLGVNRMREIANKARIQRNLIEKKSPDSANVQDVIPPR
jgi:formate hydrogenlyase subunit 3/multisubunit Na+/H+ antiporter MnhD subunit